MALERTYTIPLRKEIIKVAPYQRAKKVMGGIVAFTKRHMKQPDEQKIIIGQHLNLEVWKHGIKSPPVRVKVNMTKDDAGLVTVELFGAPKTEIKADDKKGKKAPKVVEGAATVAEEKQEDPAAEAKAEPEKKPKAKKAPKKEE